MREAKTKARIHPHVAVIESLARSINQPLPDAPIPAESIKA